MNLKRTLGAILALMGIIGIAYTATAIVQQEAPSIALLLIGIIGLLLISEGISIAYDTPETLN